MGRFSSWILNKTFADKKAFVATGNVMFVLLSLLLFCSVPEQRIQQNLFQRISQLPSDSLRFVIRHQKLKDESFSFPTIISLKGKVIKTFDDCFRTCQDINCLNYPGAKLFIFSNEKNLFYAADRNGKTSDMSSKYEYAENLGEGFTILYPKVKDNGYDIVNKNGKIIYNNKHINRRTKFVGGHLLLKIHDTWQIIDSAGNITLTFHEGTDLDAMVYEGSDHDGFVRLKDRRESYYYVDHRGKIVLDLALVLPGVRINRAGMLHEGICLVKYQEPGKKQETHTYIDTTGKIIWKSTTETGLETRNFKNGIALIKYDGADPEKLWEEAQKNGRNSYSVPIATKYINREGQEITNQDQKLNIWNTKGNLALVATPLQTLDNRMNGFGIYDLHKKKFVFTSEWPINYFDEHIIIVNHNHVYQQENDTASETLRIYNYKKKIVWKAM